MKTMKPKGGQKGITLLELLIFSAIFVTALGAVYLMYFTSHTTFIRGVNKSDLQQNARVAMEMMARELRMAGYDPSNAIPLQGSQTAIQAASASDITFIADVTGDNVSDWVRYRLQGNQVIRETSSWVGGAWTPNPAAQGELADSVSALSFAYYDGSNTVTATLASVRRITIGVTVQNTAARKTETFPLTIDLRLRNLGS